MTGIPTNIEKEISVGKEYDPSVDLKKEQTASAEVPKVPESAKNQVTPEMIREQLAKPDGVVTEEFREKVMEPIAGGEAPITASPKDELNKLITHGLPPFEEMEGVMVAIDKHRKNSDPSLN